MKRPEQNVKLVPAWQVKAGDQVVERDGYLLNVVGVDRPSVRTVALYIKDEGISKCNCCKKLRPGTLVRVFDPTSPAHDLDEATASTSGHGQSGA